MPFAGIDMGIQNVKVVILDDDGKILARSISPSGFEPAKAAEQTFREALSNAGIRRDDIKHVTATGAGLDMALEADSTISMVAADAKAGVYLLPSARTVIDVGAEESRIVVCDERGNVLDFTLNERCAAGSGAFLEAMARALEVRIEEMGELSLKAKGTASISATCVIFGETDVVSLIHRQEPKHEIARAIYDALAERIISMVHRVGLKPSVILVGGVAKDIGFTAALRRKLEAEIFVPNYPEYAGALGAALHALAKAGGNIQ
ncbi:MAG: acyl-CoA dehydratase activase [Candidatus Bathyarchaeota archaeon]|nr:acyl-CoA dehydratase activase [Candidatus Bathyarchaeota archaeon]MCX8177424.1 acyl-CoA dehydratase activase [Candidatus Bathyarchaeota archaeon]MDW8194443.1 acyl-CoA dehydratase activase [Nitrososphaerota archaeon]